MQILPHKSADYAKVKNLLPEGLIPTVERAKTPWLLLSLIALLLAWPAPRHVGSNALARFATTVRLVDNHTLELGPYAAKTNDVAIYHGRAYTDKAPGVSLFLVPAYALVRFITKDFDLALQISRLFSLTLLVLLAVWLFWRKLPDWGVDESLAQISLTTLAVGTFGWAYFSMLYGHGFVTVFILAGILWLVEYRRGNAEKVGLLIASGACFGLAIAFEFPAAVLGAVAGIYLLSFERKISRIFLFALLGVLLPALVIGGFNYAAYGDPLHLGYSQVKSEYYNARMSEGLVGIHWPSLANLYLLLLSPAKGMFFWSPVLLCGLIGCLMMIKHQRREGLLLTGMFLSYLLLFSGHFEAGGGAGLGPRHLTPLIAPLLLAGVWWAARSGAAGRGMFISLAFLSSQFSAIGVMTEPQMPDRVVNPIWEFALPMAFDGVGPGNLFGLPDKWALIIGLILLLALWLIALRLEMKTADRRVTLALRITFVLALAIYCGIGPHLGHTEPGMLDQVRGNHFMVREDYSRAVEEYQAAFKTRKDPWILYYQLSALYKAGRDAEAIRVWQQLQKFDPGFISRLNGSTATSPEP